MLSILLSTSVPRTNAHLCKLLIAPCPQIHMPTCALSNHDSEKLDFQGGLEQSYLSVQCALHAACLSMLHEHCCTTNLHYNWLMQIPLGGAFKDPGCFASSTAPGKSSPVTVSASVEGITSAAAAAVTCFIYKSQQWQPSVHATVRVVTPLPFMLTRTLRFRGAANSDSVHGFRGSDNSDECSNNHSVLHRVHSHGCIGKHRNPSGPVCQCV